MLVDNRPQCLAINKHNLAEKLDISIYRKDKLR